LAPFAEFFVVLPGAPAAGRRPAALKANVANRERSELPVITELPFRNVRPAASRRTSTACHRNFF
jgi:hypothetical protein